MGNKEILKEEIGNLFRTGEIFSVSNEILDDVLTVLADDTKWWDHHKPALGSLTSVRVSIINTIKQQRHIDKIERRNQIYTSIIVGLTVVSIIANLKQLVETFLWLWNKI